MIIIMYIQFSPPDITDLEIAEVVDTLKSGWITTGPKTKIFEQNISAYCGTEKTTCLNSATAGMELILYLLGIGEGDEVITSAYTYTATASVIVHTGAKPILVDTEKGSFEMNLKRLEKAITHKTKAIIAVDIGGMICDYDGIFKVANEKKDIFKPSNDLQGSLGRIAVIADAAHSFGATYKDKKSGNIADFSSFSFHAVKNLTTAEGGAVTWRSIGGIDDALIYKNLILLSLHGQSKDALSKTKPGAWEYDIIMPGYKFNMTDIMASLGIVQLKRYPHILKRREEIVYIYEDILKDSPVNIFKHRTDERVSSFHLCLTSIEGADEQKRNFVIQQMAERGISTNVHFKPLPMLTAYKNLGFDINAFPNAYDMYKNEISLPLHTLLTDEQAEYVAKEFKELLKVL